MKILFIGLAFIWLMCGFLGIVQASDDEKSGFNYWMVAFITLFLPLGAIGMNLFL